MSEWLRFADAALRFLFLNWAVQSTLILGAALLITRLPRLQAATRHALLAGALALAVAAPAAGLAASVLNHRWSPARPAVQAAEARRQSARSETRRTGVRRAQTASQAMSGADRRPPLPWGLLLFAGWSLIAALRLTWLTGGLWSVRRLIARARPVGRERLYEACGYALADVPVLESESVAVPSVAGVRRSRIVLPGGLAERLDLRTLQAVLLHEEAHARRRDPLYLLVAEFTEAVLFWNPLVCAARRRMEAAAEDACDAYVLSRGVAAASYARTLLSVLERAVPARRRALTCLLGWYSANGGAELKRRVTLILAGGGKTSPAAAALATVALAGAVSTSGLVEIGRRPSVPLSRRGPPALARAVERRTPPAPRPRRWSVPATTRPAARRMRPEGVMLAVAARTVAPPLPMEGQRSEGPVLAESRLRLPRESRCVVYLLDVSGSMRPHQEEAQRRLLELAGELSPRDTFNVVAFAGDFRAFAPDAVSAGELNFQRVRLWLEDLPPQSGTKLPPALWAALAVPEVTQVVIISDGEAWQHAAGRASLAALVQQKNCFGAVVRELIVGAPDRPVEQLLPGSPPPARPTLDAEQRPIDLLP